jgi:hypothetical protein
MSADLHARARALLDCDCASEISQAEQEWLADHLRNCDECNRYAELTARAIHTLSSFSFAFDPGLAARTQAALTRRAQELEAERAKRGLYLRGFVLACLFTVIGSLAAWPGWMWVAERVRVAAWESQLGFFVFWVLPSLTIAMLLLVGVGFGSSRGNERGLV